MSKPAAFFMVVQRPNSGSPMDQAKAWRPLYSNATADWHSTKFTAEIIAKQERRQHPDTTFEVARVEIGFEKQGGGRKEKGQRVAGIDGSRWGEDDFGGM